jgi:hypothetical protein
MNGRLDNTLDLFFFPSYIDVHIFFLVYLHSILLDDISYGHF